MGAGRPRTRRTEGIRRLAPRVQPRARGERPSSYYSSLAGLPFVYKIGVYKIGLCIRLVTKGIINEQCYIPQRKSLDHIRSASQRWVAHLGSLSRTASTATSPTYSPLANTTDANSDEDSDDELVVGAGGMARVVWVGRA